MATLSAAMTSALEQIHATSVIAQPDCWTAIRPACCWRETINLILQSKDADATYCTCWKACQGLRRDQGCCECNDKRGSIKEFHHERSNQQQEGICKVQKPAIEGYEVVKALERATKKCQIMKTTKENLLYMIHIQMQGSPQPDAAVTATECKNANLDSYYPPTECFVSSCNLIPGMQITIPSPSPRPWPTLLHALQLTRGPPTVKVPRLRRNLFVIDKALPRYAGRVER
jgi:hypothetical protein